MGASVSVVESDNPLFSPGGDLPVFRHKSFVCSDFDSLVLHFAGERFSTDHALTAKQEADSKALKMLVQARLKPAFELDVWLNETNCHEFTRPWFAKKLAFPLGLFFPSRYVKRASELVRAAAGLECLEDEVDQDGRRLVETRVHARAEEALQILCQRLVGSGGGGGKNQRFLLGGTCPTSVDALVFAYLAPILRAPLPDKTWQNKVKTYTEVASYVQRIAQAYFPCLQKEKLRDEKEEEDSSETMTVSTGRNIMSALVAVCAMSGYLYVSGLFSRHL